jgi:integrase
MDTIETFLDRYKLRSKFTVKCYRSTLNKFFETIEQDPSTYFDFGISIYKKKYEDDITKWYNTILGLAPKSRDAKLFTIKSFMVRNGVDLPSLFWKDLRELVITRGPVKKFDIPTRDDIRRILIHASTQMRAIILFAVSSGMRIGEILQLQEEDINFDTNPVQVFISAEIGGRQRYTFITAEAKEALMEWLHVKSQYLATTKHLRKSVNSNLLFPFEYSTVADKWRELLKKTELYKKDKNTDTVTMNFHNLRKFCDTQLSYHLPNIEVDYIIGHAINRPEYKVPAISRMGQDYLKAEPDLSIFNQPKIDNEDEYKQQIREKIEKEYQKKLQTFVKRIDALERTVDRLESIQ